MQGQKITLSKTTFNGERGYNEAQGQRKDFEVDQLNESMKTKGIFEELYYTEEQLELVSINSINYEDAYKVKVTIDGKVSHRYYSVENGLLLSSEDSDDNNNVVKGKIEESFDKNFFPFAKNFMRNTKDRINVFHHMGIYCYETSTLKKFISFDQSKNEIKNNRI